MLLDNLLSAPDAARRVNLGKTASHTAAAVNDNSFRDVFQSLTKTLEKSRTQSAGQKDAAPTPDNATGAPATSEKSPFTDEETRPADNSRPTEENLPDGENAELDEKKDNSPAEDDLAALLPVLAPMQQEIIERITVLAADNGLDPQMLAGLDANELTELADWVLNGAGGLFPDADAMGAAGRETPEKTAGFGLSTAAITQFENLIQRVANAPVRDTALIGDLIDLNTMPTLDIDRLAQAVLQVAGAAENGTSADLRTLLTNTPSDALRTALENALAQTPDSGITLPEMPEVALKSLAVEIVNVNNVELDAADKRLELLNGLDNNAQLRADLLRQINDADADSLTEAVDGEKFGENLQNSPVIDDLLENGTEVVIDKNAANTAAAQTAISSARRETPENVLPENPVKGKAKAENAKNPATAEISAADENSPEEPLTIEMTENPEVNSDETATSEKPLPKTETRNAHAAKTENGAESAENFEEAENPAGEFRPAENTAQTFSMHRDNPLNFDYGAAKEAENSRQAVLQDNINRLAELVEQAAKNSATTLKSLTLALNPHELGSVRVELEMTQSGGVNATIKVENDSARSLMMSGIDQLKKSLELQGVNLEQFNIEMDGKDAGDQRQNPQQQAAGGEWFDAQSDERERRAREAANRIDTPRARPAEEIEEETADETPRMRHIDGNSFELIA